MLYEVITKMPAGRNHALGQLFLQRPLCDDLVAAAVSVFGRLVFHTAAGHKNGPVRKLVAGGQRGGEIADITVGLLV